MRVAQYQDFCFSAAQIAMRAQAILIRRKAYRIAFTIQTRLRQIAHEVRLQCPAQFRVKLILRWFRSIEKVFASADN